MSEVDPLGAALATLYLNFPSGVTEAIKATQFSELRRLGFEPEVVAEAALRILHSREQRTVPPLAVVLRACREVQSERAPSTSDEKAYSAAEARDLAVRRLKYMNSTPGKRIPVNDANIEAELGRMSRIGFRIVGGAI